MHRAALSLVALVALAACGGNDKASAPAPDALQWRASNALTDALPGGPWRVTRLPRGPEVMRQEMVEGLDPDQRKALEEGFEVGLEVKAVETHPRALAATCIRFRAHDAARTYADVARAFVSGAYPTLNGMTFRLRHSADGIGPDGALPGWVVDFDVTQGDRTLASRMYCLVVDRYVVVATPWTGELAEAIDLPDRLRRVHAILAAAR